MNDILRVFCRLTIILLLSGALSLGVHRPEKLPTPGPVSVKKASTQFDDSAYYSFNTSVFRTALSLAGQEKSQVKSQSCAMKTVSKPARNCITTENPTNRSGSLQSGPSEVRAKEISKPIPVFQAIKTFDQLRAYNINDVEHVTLRDVFLTAYSLDVRSTGKTPASADYGITFSGTRATAGRTVAVDPRIIPIGTPIYIDLQGVGWRIAEDTGGAVKGRHIDVLLNSEQAAIQFGVKRHIQVYIPITDPVSVLATSSNKP